MAIPQTLETATDQAKAATQAAISAGLTRLQVDMAIPELNHQPIAQQFLTVFQEMGLQFRVYFPDAGAAALAKRDWNNPDFEIRGLTERVSQLAPEDQAILIVNPSAVEVADVEKTCAAALDRPVVLLNPQLENVATIGIGYAGRQLRDRFLSTLETCYYLRPLDGGVVYRAYPGPWQVWQEQAEGQHSLVLEQPTRPSGEAIEAALYGTDEAETDAGEKPQKPKRGLLAELQQFIRALTQ